MRFVFCTVVFVIIGGVLLHMEAKLPWIGDWYGNLPGDMILMKGKMLIYLPIVSSAAISLVLSVLLILLFPSK